MEELKQINLTDSPIIEPIKNQEVLPMKPKNNHLVLSLVIIGASLGLGAGYFFAQNNLLKTGGSMATSGATQNLSSTTQVKVGDTFGSADEKTFRDQAEGILVAGGIEGEGSHHIERGANKTQWVYITSSVVDLDLLVGDRVTVWGETNQGKKAGWLMDVGRLKVLELNAAPASVDTTNQD